MIVKKCLVCGKEFKTYLCRIKIRKGNFCSNKCYSQSRIGKPNFWFKGKKAPWAKNNQQTFKKGHIPWNTGKKLLNITGEKNPSWKSGKFKSLGYVLIYSPDHPFPNHNKRYSFEHRLVVEKQLDRHLTRQERIHHINGIKDDNRPENLYLFPNNSTHFKFHFLKDKPQLQSNII